MSKLVTIPPRCPKLHRALYLANRRNLTVAARLARVVLPIRKTTVVTFEALRSRLIVGSHTDVVAFPDMEWRPSRADEASQELQTCF